MTSKPKPPIQVENTMKLRIFREHIQDLIGTADHVRPFVCDGSPYDCVAFVVGINPASKVPFWPYWSDETGFNKRAWLDQYREQRMSEPSKENRTLRRPISNTRQRIKRIAKAASPTKILETNLYALPTSRASELRSKDKDAQVFDFLLAEIAPRAILLHGKDPADHFRKQFGYAPTPEFNEIMINKKSVYVAAVAALSRVSYDRASELGKTIQAKIALNR